MKYLKYFMFCVKNAGENLRTINMREGANMLKKSVIIIIGPEFLQICLLVILKSSSFTKFKALPIIYVSNIH